MIRAQSRTQCAPILAAGVAGGLLLALLLDVGGGRVTGMLLVGAPFVLAALTGVAKSTTA
jgi:hypothetical protein